MNALDGPEPLVRELESLSDQSEEQAKKRRMEIWAQLAPMFKKTDDRDLVAFLSAELQLQAITITRWMSGQYNPRQIHFPRIRSLLGIPQRAPLSPSLKLLGEKPDRK